MTAEKIRAFRTSKGLTQEELGKLCGVGKSSVSQWESGATEPSGPSRVILEDYLSGERALIPLTPLEEKLLNELLQRSGLATREELLKKLVLDAIAAEPADSESAR
ncbi:helix-turn-helix domain-containing protein [Luteolibacter marinus]|uniref:helix-turn-helix domain-containing protein n=1 Tax=Luteolibacter marinus TaxID=2776705 RepID=UPI0018684215|nr:helix-turn-helix transcriptional regulator [Luteolibacter marinus]